MHFIEKIPLNKYLIYEAQKYILYMHMLPSIVNTQVYTTIKTQNKTLKLYIWAFLKKEISDLWRATSNTLTLLKYTNFLDEKAG